MSVASSASSSSSDSDSSSSSSILGASQWNREKARRPVQGKPGWGIGLVSSVDSDANTGNDKEESGKDEQQRHLLQRRLYPALSFPTQASSSQDTTSGEDPKEKESTTLPEKSELELAVLQDVLSTNFLFSHLPKAEHQFLLSNFEKVKFRQKEVILRQGDPVEYFYLLYLGDVKILQDGMDMKPSDADKYAVFGELELLTNATQSATVKAISTTCTLFRLSKKDYQRALSHQQQSTSLDDAQKSQLLKDALPQEMVEYLEGDEIALKKLVSAMTTHTFTKGKVLYRKETRLAALVIIAQGQVVAKDISMGGRAYEDMVIGPGESKTSFGWQSILSDNTNNTTTTQNEEERMTGTIVAATDGAALVISKKAFTNALGHHRHDGGPASLPLLAAKRLARIQLQQITVFRDSALTDTQIHGLLDLMHHYEYSPNETIFKVGDKVEAAMYFVREGSVVLETNRGQDHQTIEAGGYFGEKHMLLDQNKEGQKHFEFRSPMTVIAAADTTILTKVDVLYLEECRQVVNTTVLGLGQPVTVSAIDDTVQWSDITRHAMLGTGSFGQVWLASTPAPSSSTQEETTGTTKDSTNDSNVNNSQRRIVALKVQAKHLLAQSPDKAERIVAEKNIMTSLRSPFIIRLLNSFQDDKRLYMITSILQGGELESIIPHDGLSEGAAKFYAAGVLEGLSYLHRRHIIHRDVKPENVLIDDKGYPVLIDLGFAKYVPDKTYTFCGSPMLTAPEIIRSKGYDRGVDNWAWAVLVYRLVTGKYPFYQKGMDELGLYKRICRGTFEVDGTMSIEFRMLMVAMLYPDPTQRLGSRVNGWRDIFAAPWFANDETIDLRKLRKQQITAPWVPDLKDPLDASRFHNDSSNVEDLMMASMPGISEAQQKIFDSFGSHVADE